METFGEEEVAVFAGIERGAGAGICEDSEVGARFGVLLGVRCLYFKSKCAKLSFAYLISCWFCNKLKSL